DQTFLEVIAGFLFVFDEQDAHGSAHWRLTEPLTCARAQSKSNVGPMLTREAAGRSAAIPGCGSTKHPCFVQMERGAGMLPEPARKMRAPRGSIPRPATRLTRDAHCSTATVPAASTIAHSPGSWPCIRSTEPCQHHRGSDGH